MRIENGYLQQSMLCSKNNRNAVGNFSDTMNKAQECISNKISTRDSYVNSTDYSNFGIYTQNSISQDIELPIETERYKIEDATYVCAVCGGGITGGRSDRKSDFCHCYADDCGESRQYVYANRESTESLFVFAVGQSGYSVFKADVSGDGGVTWITAGDVALYS